MKRFFQAFGLLALLFGGLCVAVACGYNEQAVARGPETRHVYQTEIYTVDTFEDNGNVCYVAKTVYTVASPPSIFCLKK